MLNAYNPDAYAYEKLADPIKVWSDIASRQDAKDRALFPFLFQYFYPSGSVLELGAGAGQISKLIDEYDYEVLAFDYRQFFVDPMRQTGLKAYCVDATNIAEACLGEFHTIFSRSIPQLTTCDLDIVERTYASMRDALAPGGRIVMIYAMCSTWREVETQARNHMRVARKCGLKNVWAFGNKIIPSRAYRVIPASIANRLEEWLGRRWGTRFVLLAEKPEPGNAWQSYKKKSLPKGAVMIW